jgi:transglutaminase-like putative cysteine protease
MSLPPASRLRPLLVLLLLAPLGAVQARPPAAARAGVATARRGAPAEPFLVRRPAPWVQPLPVEAGARHPELEAAASGGQLHLLVDQQTRVGARPGEVERYVHQATRVLSEAGTQAASDVRIAFDPHFQRLTLHGVWLHRAGRPRRPVLQARQVKVIQQEQGLEEQLYDGSLTALFFVPDVRAGDVVELAYTLTGDNPVFGGRFSDSLETRYGVPVEHWRQRLLWPARRTLVVTPHGTPLAPAVTPLPDGAREYVWEQRAVPALTPDDGLPTGFDPWPWVQLSEWADWGAVVDWALPLYEAPQRLPRPLAREVARLGAAAGEDEGARLLAALRFVQDEVRYLGIELGPNSHQPHRPAQVLARRFGDCKDKSLLLVTLLRALGLSAEPALVHTELRASLDAWHATPLAFDHVIVRARAGGREVWVDPTRSLERGGLAALQPPPFARALVLTPGSRGLTPMPAPEAERPLLEVEEVYREEAPEKGQAVGPTRLTVTTTYRGTEADGMRYQLATTPRADLARDYLNYYARSAPGLESAGGLEVQDAPQEGTLTVVERYTLPPSFWGDGGRQLGSTFVRERLERPRITRRTMPLGLSHPEHVRHRVRVQGPVPYAVPSAARVVDAPGFRVEVARRQEAGGVLLDFRYRSLAAAVAPEQLDAHLAALEEAEEWLDAPVERGGGGPGADAAQGQEGARERPAGALRRRTSATLVGALALVGLLALLGAFAWALRALGRRRGAGTAVPAAASPPPPRAPAAPGATAEEALELPPADVAAHLAAHACATCDARGTSHPHQQTRRVEGRAVTRFSWTCPGCGEPQRVFVATPEAGEQAA